MSTISLESISFRVYFLHSFVSYDFEGFFFPHLMHIYLVETDEVQSFGEVFKNISLKTHPYSQCPFL